MVTAFDGPNHAYFGPMGTYTTYAQIGASSWYGSRSRRLRSAAEAHGAHSEPAPVELLHMQCPKCEQSYPFPGTCPTCEVVLVDRTKVLIVPKHADHTEVATVGSPFIFIGGVLAIGLPMLSMATFSHSNATAFVGLGLIAGLAALGTAPHLVRSLLGWRRRRASVRSRHAADAQVEHISIGELPASCAVPVRIRGRLRVAVEGSEVSAWIEGDDGIAILPVSQNLRVATTQGFEELDEITASQVVEVVGVGRRVPRGGACYRETENTFVFDENEIVDVWV